VLTGLLRAPWHYGSLRSSDLWSSLTVLGNVP